MWRLAALLVVLVLLAGCARELEYRPAESRGEVPATAGVEVLIAEVAPDGSVRKAAQVPKVVMTDEGWRRRLTALGFAVLRTKATELAFTGRYDKHYESGLYRCAGCNTALFHSSAKFDSRTGWPSFTMPVAHANIYTQVDMSYGQSRDEVLCRRCDGHLGHVFPDGPEPGGLRYCMNSSALRFDSGVAEGPPDAGQERR